MKNKNKFIVTQDQETADKFVLAGLRLINNSNGTYTFENKLTGNLNFSNIDVKKFTYTNILTF